MVCDILNWRCIIVNELIGSGMLAAIIFAITFFIFASKIRLGFDTTIFLAIPIIILFSFVTVGFAALFAFGAVLAGWLLALAFNRLTGNR